MNYRQSGKILMNMKNLLLIALLILVCGSASGQSSVKALTDYMTEFKTNHYATIPSVILGDSKNEVKIIKAAIPFCYDTSREVSLRAYYILDRVARKSHSNEAQRLAIHAFVLGLKKNDPAINSQATTALTGYRRENFLKSERDTIAARLTPNYSNLSGLLKLAGYLELQQSIPVIEALSNGQVDMDIKWAANLALSRMGVQSGTNFVLSRVSNARMDDNLVYDIVPDLIYTRNADVYKFLENALSSNDENCQSANPDFDENILCGYRIMELIAPTIRDFPIKTDAAGELATTDYKAALVKTRNWFAANQNYKIITDQF
jgi:hypothetical protein